MMQSGCWQWRAATFSQALMMGPSVCGDDSSPITHLLPNCTLATPVALVLLHTLLKDCGISETVCGMPCILSSRYGCWNQSWCAIREESCEQHAKKFRIHRAEGLAQHGSLVTGCTFQKR